MQKYRHLLNSADANLPGRWLIPTAVAIWVLFGFGISITQAGMVNINPVYDGVVQDTNYDGTFDTLNTTADVLDLRNFNNPGSITINSRAIAKYSLSSVPGNAIIDSANFVFGISGYTNGTTVSLSGYSTRSSISLSDATLSASTLGSYEPALLGLGTHSISLNSSVIQPLLPTCDLLGVRLSPSLGGNTGVYSTEAATSYGMQAPQLQISYHVPPPPGIITASNMASGFVPSNSAHYVGDVYPRLNYTNEAAGQRFTATVSGKLSTILASIDEFNAQGVPLIVKFHTADGNLPGPVLGSLTIDDNNVYPNFRADFNELSLFDFTSQNISIVAGQSYVVTFEVATPGEVRYRALLKTSGADDFGTNSLFSADALTYQQSTVSDEMGLTVRVVPEPATLTLLGILFCVGVVWTYGSRRNSGW